MTPQIIGSESPRACSSFPDPSAQPHVTGNFVVLAADLARGAHGDEWLKLATFPIFVVAVLTSTWVHRSMGSGVTVRSRRALLAAKSVLFGTAAIVGWFTQASVSGPGRIAIVTLLVTAMGIQNAMHRLTPTLGPMTTVMTGNVTSWLVEALAPITPDGAPKRRLLGLPPRLRSPGPLLRRFAGDRVPARALFASRQASQAVGS